MGSGSKDKSQERRELNQPQAELDKTQIDTAKSRGDLLEPTEAFGEPQKAVPAAGKDQPPIPPKLGRYRIHGLLGSGGFGEVYLGFDDQLKRKVAIKVPRTILSGIELDKFLEEARRLAQLRHPAIVTVFDVGEFDGKCYIVADYLEGISLHHWIGSEQYSWQQAVLVIAQLAEALAHAHSLGTVHRDVKPSNVVMLPDHKPVLIDFGLAISDSQGGEAPGMVAGTPSYMSPEQVKGKAHRIDGRTDIYCLGVTMYHLLCRKRPFRSADRYEVVRQILEDEPQPLRQIVPEIPIEVERICFKAMAKKTADRYTTALDFAADLRKVVGDANVSSASSIPVTSAESEAADSGRSTERRLHEAERRQITTLYLDLDDSELDVDDQDPEELHSFMQRIRELTARVVGRFGGHMSQSSSEAIQVYFGYPRAFEDSARRAALAGLEIAREITSLQDRLRGSGELILDFRIGIHTGIVVTEENEMEVSSERHSIVGNVPRVAGGLAELAEPGVVVVSGATRNILGDAFECKSLGAHSSRSIGRNVEVFEVVGERTSQSSASETSAATTPLIGREHEMGLLTERWNQARNGSGQVVLLCAEAGVGKSRLLASLREKLVKSEIALFETRCSTYYQNTAFHSISELLLQLAQIDPEDDDETKRAKLEALLRHYQLPLEETVPLLAELISIPPGPTYSVLEVTPERRKQRTIETLVELTLIASESQPLLFTIEDVHWVDPSTLEFLSVLIEQVPTAAVLLVITHRPSFNPPWPSRPNFAQLTISQLSANQTIQVITQVTGGRKLPEQVLQHIISKAGGIPLYTEELTKAIIESDLLTEADGQWILARPLNSVDVPGTLQDSLMSRLDRLGGAKEIAQLAAVIGREFSFQLLAAVAPLEEQTLKTELTALVDAELIHQRGFFPRAKFTFKHALVRDIAYGSLLRKARQQWHGRIAAILEAEFPQIAEAEPELLARHYTEAGLTQQAIPGWLKAGLQAQEQSGNAEAVNHFRQGLALIETMEPSDERDLLEFQFLIPLGVALLTSQGYAAPDVGPIFDRARALSLKFGGPGEQFHILWGTWAWRVVREELKLCLEYTTEAGDVVAPTGDAGLQMEALFIPALTLFYLGDYAGSIRCCEQGFPLYDQETCKLHARHTGQNVGVTLQCYWALSLWHLGYPDQARQRIERAIDLARSIKHPFSLCYALGHSAWLHHSCRMQEALKAAADEELAFASEQGFLFWIAEGTLHQGFHALLDGRPEDALGSLATGLEIFDKTGANLSRCHFYSAVGDAHLLAGRTDEALRWNDDALAASAINGNVFQLAEIHRLRGEIMLSRGDQEEAERCYRSSLQVARSQNAKSWELRTMISLFRLRQQQNRADEARGELQQVFGWFREGFSTPDLIDAKQLLDASS